MSLKDQRQAAYAKVKAALVGKNLSQVKNAPYRVLCDDPRLPTAVIHGIKKQIIREKKRAIMRAIVDRVDAVLKPDFPNVEYNLNKNHSFTVYLNGKEL